MMTPYEQLLGDSGKEELSFNKIKAQGGTAICLLNG